MASPFKIYRYIVERFMDGVILVDKEKGFTSHDVVSIVKKKLNTKKVGHAGTLDPMATGVLPILVGKGTKISKYLIEHDKTYVATIKLGIKTSTGDLEGNVIKTADYVIDENTIREVLESVVGIQKQIPPIYSAIKVNGKKLYEYARKGEQVEIPEREIEIYSIKLENIIGDEITFEVKCSKGTYIRTLCEDVAEKLGTVGTMSALKRTQVNTFTISNSIKIDEISKENIIPIEDIFKDKEKIILKDEQFKLFLNGVPLENTIKGDIALIYKCNNEFIGIGENRKGMLIRDIVLD